jgi:hypothetical protein
MIVTLGPTVRKFAGRVLDDNASPSWDVLTKEIIVFVARKSNFIQCWHKHIIYTYPIILLPW